MGELETTQNVVYRIQRKRTKGWRMPDNTVYVGRPSIWGNPFKGEGAVERYREAVNARSPGSKGRWIDEEIEIEWVKNGGDWFTLAVLVKRVREYLEPLRGKNLMCWCPPDKPCHADVLLVIANELAQTECDRRNREKGGG